MMLRPIFKQQLFYSKRNIINNLKVSSNLYHTAKESFFVDSSENIKIEVLRYPPVKQTNYPPILFIHGGFMAAWCWDNFSHLFSNKGHECYALSFRGNGQSTKTPEKDKWWKLEDFTKDISAVNDVITAKTKDKPKPILVGHSMGGSILQRYLQDNHQKVSCGVLYTSVSPYTYKTDFFSAMLKQPKLPILYLKSLLNPYSTVSTPELFKEAFFSSAFPISMVREIHPKLDKNLSRGVMFQFLKPFVDPSKIKCPMVVIGGTEDKTFIDNVQTIKETGEAYGVGYDMIEDCGHAIMLDLNWEEAAKVGFNRIHERISNKN